MVSKNQGRHLVRDRIARDVERFLASGGAVQVIEPGLCASRADDNSFLFSFEGKGGAVALEPMGSAEVLLETGDDDAEHDAELPG